MCCSCVSVGYLNGAQRTDLLSPSPFLYFRSFPPACDLQPITLQQLNKFCVTPRHFLLVTKDFKPQTSPLSPLELIAAWQIVKQLGAREKHLAFFNSGELSGASQPHKQ